MWPAFKNYNAVTGAADNAYFEVIERFAFVVVSDLHTSDSYPNATVTSNLQQIRDWVISPTPEMPAPKFMVITGDFPHLWQTEATIDSVIGPDFLWYPVIGNHEVSDDINNFNQIRDTKVPSLPNVVSYGPVGSQNTTYSWDFGNAHFVAINSYWDGTTNPGADHAVDGDIRPQLRTWIENDLASFGRTHNFAFVHEPAYPAHRHVGDSLDAFPANRDAFVTTLNDGNVQSLFSGHTHYYEHDIAPEYALGDLHQITSGYLRAFNDGLPTITYVLVGGTETTYKVYRRTSSSTPFSLYEEWTISTGPVVEIPQVPLDFLATAVSDFQINLTWTDNSLNESGFEIWSSDSLGIPVGLLATVTANTISFSDTGLDPLTEYCYLVRAVNAAGESAYAAVSCDETPEEPVVPGVLEDFESGYTLGAELRIHPDWFYEDANSGPKPLAGIGVANSIGLSDGDRIFTWVTQPFTWSEASLTGVVLQMDFKTDGSAHFDDDRLGWMISKTDDDSIHIFGAQMDPGGTGYNIECYWQNTSSADYRGTIANLPALTANAWYRFRLEVIKLTATSARVDVSLTALDASGNPGAVVASGSIADTSALGTNAPNAKYFNAATMWPAYKNFTAAAAPADNAYFQLQN